MSALSSNLRPVGSGNALWYAPTDGISFNGDLFVGGVIKAYGKRTGNGFRLKWNEERWREIEGPVLQRFVPCIHRGALVSLFADGAYGSANGSSKRITGPLPPGQAAATISWNGQLVLGGRFFEVQSPVPRSMYAWDGNAWQRIGSGLREATVRTVAVVNNELYASGIIPEDESVPLSNIARWDGTQWRPLGMGLDEGASALIEFEGQLIAGGSFTKSGDQEIGHAARWDGTNWHSLGDLGQPVRCFAILDGELFAGTEGLQPYPFEQIPANVFRWTGSEWEPQSPGIYSYPRDRINSRGIRVNSLVAHEGQLWAFGTFDFVGDVPSTGVAVLSPSTGRFATGIEDARTRSALELSIAHSGAGQLAIRYALASTSPARLQVFDVAGRRRAGIELSTSARGAHDLTWRPVDGDGRALGSGIYFLRLQQDQNAATKRLVWIR